MAEKEKKEKIPRQPMPEQDPKKRSKNFDEVPFGYTPELAQKEASRCLQCKKPKCIEGCPVGVKIPEFINLITEGDFIAAAKKLKEDNSLPAVCGRVCPQESQCESFCVLGALPPITKEARVRSSCRSSPLPQGKRWLSWALARQGSPWQATWSSMGTR
jgi:ferredoxin